MPRPPRAHRDLSGRRLTALVTPDADLVRVDDGYVATVYADTGSPALLRLGSVTSAPLVAVAVCGDSRCDWTTRADDAAQAAAALAGHHGVEAWTAAACAREWALACAEGDA